MGFPNFVITGAARAGTTTVYNWLNQHPDVYLSRVKEPSYFAFDPTLQSQPKCPHSKYVWDWTKYQSLFPDSRSVKAIGEASTLYLQSPEAPERLYRTIPNAKLIVILRDPVERAYSHYCLHRFNNLEPIAPFIDAVKAWEHRKNENWMGNWDYISAGMYAQDLNNYYKNFDRSQILVLFFEDLRLNPQQFMRDVCMFLDVDPAFEFNTTELHNAAALPKDDIVSRMFFTYIDSFRTVGQYLPQSLRGKIFRKLAAATTVAPKITPDERNYMIEIFRDDIIKLESMTGRNLRSWYSLIPDEMIQSITQRRQLGIIAAK